MSHPSPADAANVSGQPPPPPPPPAPSLHQLQASFAAFTPRYQAAMHDPSSIKPLLIPADAYFTPRCSVCAASFATIHLLEAHVRAIHPSFYASAQHASQLANAVSPTASSSAPHDASFLPPWLRPGDALASCAPPPVRNGAAQPFCERSVAHPTPVVTKPDTLQYRCQLCNVSCDTMAQFTSHSAGQKHRKKADLFNAFKRVEKRFPAECIRFEAPSLWLCSLCNTCMQAHNEVLQHMQCAKHKRLLNAAQLNPSVRRAAAHNLPVTAIKPASVSAAMAVMQSPVSESLTPSRVSPSRQQDAPMQLAPTSCGTPVHGAIVKPPKSNKTAAYACAVCNVSCTSNDNLNVHLASARHRRKVEGSALIHNIVCNVCQITVSGAANYEAHLKGKTHAKKQQQREAALHKSASALLSMAPAASDVKLNAQAAEAQPVPYRSGAQGGDAPSSVALPAGTRIAMPLRSVPYPARPSGEQS